MKEDFEALICGMSFWAIKERVKDHTIQRKPTEQLLKRMDIYRMDAVARRDLLAMEEGKDQLAFVHEKGKLLRTSGLMKAHSWVIAYLQCQESLWAHPQGATPSDGVSIKDTGGTNRSMTSLSSWGTTNSFYGGLEAPSTNNLYGILWGTGTTTPATADYMMTPLITHGSSAGLLQYGATTVNAAGVVAANVDMIISRVAVNGSGGTVTPREQGLVTARFTPYYFLWAHDAVNQAIGNTEVVVGSYCWRTTV